MSKLPSSEEVARDFMIARGWAGDADSDCAVVSLAAVVRDYGIAILDEVERRTSAIGLEACVIDDLRREIAGE